MGAQANRPLVIHYHLFKNAGTSVDAMLKDNFGARWAGFEPAAGVGVAEFIAAHDDVQAISTHTAQFPLPEVDGVEILPIVFLRDPLDRIFSAYLFEKDQVEQTFGSELARRTSFADYVRTRLQIAGDRQCRNYHVHRFSALQAGPADSELDRGLAGLTGLPFVGLVEHFSRSCLRLGAWLRGYFPDFAEFEQRWNASRRLTNDIEARHVIIRAELGAALYRELFIANLKDYCLYDAAVRLIGEQSRAALPAAHD